MIREKNCRRLGQSRTYAASDCSIFSFSPISPVLRIPAPPRLVRGVVIDASTNLTRIRKPHPRELRAAVREGKLAIAPRNRTRELNFPSFESSQTRGRVDGTSISRTFAQHLRASATITAEYEGERGLRVPVQEEEPRLIDMDQVTRVALIALKNSGIIFLD